MAGFQVMPVLRSPPPATLIGTPAGANLVSHATWSTRCDVTNRASSPPLGSHVGPTSMQGAPPGSPMRSQAFTAGLSRSESATRTTLQGAVPKELAAKFEKHKRDAGEAIAARKAAAAAQAQFPNNNIIPTANSQSCSELRRSSPPRAQARSKSRDPSRQRGPSSMEDLDHVQHGSMPCPVDRDHRSLSPRRSVAKGSERAQNRRGAQDDAVLAKSNASGNGGRQMFDKRTLRRKRKDDFLVAIQQWRTGHVAPGGKLRRTHGCHVSIRLRPMPPKELQQGEFEAVSAVEESHEVIVHNCLFQADLVRMYVHHSGFIFPRVFGSTSSNEDVYAECGWPLVSHALSGELGTLFMFGQTGSGKTYTMSALMELAARDIFAAIGDRDEVPVRLKAFEVAGKKCFDLLPKQRKQLKLLHDQYGRTNIVGAVEAPVPSAEECLRLIREALSRRRTAMHARNDESSRSHCVCILNLLAVGGSLILVDCAGTERRQDSDQHSHERMRESAEINSSLHALKECIRYRAKQQQVAAKTSGEGHEEDEQQHIHVPYRDSQLTRVLHESFTRSGSYLAAIGTISPSSVDTEHTMSTLKTLQLLMSESGSSDAPNFEQRVDVDPKATLKSSAMKQRPHPQREPHRSSPTRATRQSISEKSHERAPLQPSNVNSARCTNSLSKPMIFSQQRGELKESEKLAASHTSTTGVTDARQDTPQAPLSRQVRNSLSGSQQALRHDTTDLQYQPGPGRSHRISTENLDFQNTGGSIRLDISRRSYEADAHRPNQTLAHSGSEVRPQRGVPQAWRMEEPQPQPHPRRMGAQDVVNPEFPQGDDAMRLEITRLQQQVVQLETALLEAQGSSDDASKRIPPSAVAGKGSFRAGAQNCNGLKPVYRLAEPCLLSWPSTLA